MERFTYRKITVYRPIWGALMNRKRKWIKPIIFTVLLLMVGLLLFNPFRQSDYDKWADEVSEAQYLQALATLKESTDYIRKFPYISFLETQTIRYDLTDLLASMDASNLPAIENFDYAGLKATDLRGNNSALYHVNVPEAGLYYLSLDYYVLPQVLNNLTVSVKINGSYLFDDSKTIDIPLYWQDDSKDFVLDTYGDESLPSQQRVLGWVSKPLHNNTYTTTEPLLFYFDQGLNTIEVDNIMNGAMLVGDLKLIAPKERPDYQTYIAAHASEALVSDPIFINAIDYTQKNSSYVRLMAFQSPSVTPYGVVDKKLNVINGAAWYRSGHEVSYE
mgnify:FL=1